MKAYGAKAQNLLVLTEAGFNVPKFYSLSAQNDQIVVTDVGKKKLLNEFQTWKSNNNVSTVAVRSSSDQEDGTKHSFAGQFLTVLDVSTGQKYLQALQAVFSSKQNVEYAKDKGSVHVIVQDFIEPDMSGVIFTVNPVNGNHEIVINAANGRGTNVVDGSESVQYFVERTDSSSYSVNNEADLEVKLTAPHIAELHKLSLAIESIFGLPQDIEWAIKDDEYFILQSRPITRINHLKLWDSANISESFPGIVLPLTFSIAKRGYLLGYKSQAYSGGIPWHTIEAEHRNFESMIGIFNGRMYYNLLSWYTYISMFPGSSKNQQFLDDQIETQGQSLYQKEAKFSFVYQARYYSRLLYRVLFYKQELNQFYKRFASFDHQLATYPAYGDSQILMSKYKYIEGDIIPHFGRTLDNDFLVMTYHGWLKKKLRAWLPGDMQGRNSIIGSIDGVMSTKQALVLYEIAGALKQDKKAYELMLNRDYSALEQYLERSPLHNSMQEYIDTFGHRFAEDQKIESINPILEKHGLLKLLSVYAKLDSQEISERLQKASSNSKETERKIKSKLRPYQKMLYIFLIKRLKIHLKHREKNRLYRGRVYGYMRELFPKVGKAFADEKVITKSFDIFYLEIDEIYQILQGSLVSNDIKQRIADRKKSYTTYKNIHMPDRFITTALPSLQEIEPLIITKNKKEHDKVSLAGLISSPGTVEGRVVVLHEPKIPDEPYDILVASHTDPGWTPLIALAKGIIVEHGGMLSHAAIVTRELGIPSIVGVKNASSVLKTGMKVRINTQTSEVDILS
jgi:phosphohistidine swiveling domain-containing protein